MYKAFVPRFHFVACGWIDAVNRVRVSSVEYIKNTRQHPSSMCLRFHMPHKSWMARTHKHQVWQLILTDVLPPTHTHTHIHHLRRTMSKSTTEGDGYEKKKKKWHQTNNIRCKWISILYAGGLWLRVCVCVRSVDRLERGLQKNRQVSGTPTHIICILCVARGGESTTLDIKYVLGFSCEVYHRFRVWKSIHGHFHKKRQLPASTNNVIHSACGADNGICVHTYHPWKCVCVFVQSEWANFTSTTSLILPQTLAYALKDKHTHPSAQI